MAITINGSGTIGGVSVGGLPDGIVDTDMLASNAVTSSLLPVGSVVQMTNGVYTGGNINSSVNSTWLDSGISHSITPTSSSNKIIVGFFNIGGHVNWANTNKGSFYSIYRDIGGGGYSNLGDSTGGLLSNIVSTDTSHTAQKPISMLIVDSPATTSVVTYKPYWKALAGSDSYFHHVNYGTGHIYYFAMEIAA